MYARTQVMHLPVFRKESNRTMRRRKKKPTRNKSNFDSPHFSVRTIAHDLNNTLTNVLGNITLLRLNISTDLNKENLQLLKSAEKALTQARGLTQQFFTFTKNGELARETVSVVQLV